MQQSHAQVASLCMVPATDASTSGDPQLDVTVPGNSPYASISGAIIADREGGSTQTDRHVPMESDD